MLTGCERDIQVFSAPSPPAAPANDLALLQSLAGYKDEELIKVVARTFESNLWYLSERLVSLALFDSNKSTETKRKGQQR